MLKLSDISNNIETIQNESDFYIKIKMIFGNRHPNGDPICYWSSLGANGSFIEIGIKKNNGAIHEITVISMPSVCHEAFSTVPKQGVEKNGLPLFRISDWLEKDPNALIKGYYIRAYPNIIPLRKSRTEAPN